MKANKSRCFKVVGCSTRSTWFHKKQDRREFWHLTSQLLALDVCLSDAFS
ncbi:DUF645 family protein [Vibrio cholerae]